jgi:hypothetical protein
MTLHRPWFQVRTDDDVPELMRFVGPANMRHSYWCWLHIEARMLVGGSEHPAGNKSESPMSTRTSFLWRHSVSWFLATTTVDVVHGKQVDNHHLGLRHFYQIRMPSTHRTRMRHSWPTTRSDGSVLHSAKPTGSGFENQPRRHAPSSQDTKARSSNLEPAS